MEAAREIAGLVAQSNNKLMLDSDALLLDRESTQRTDVHAQTLKRHAQSATVNEKTDGKK